MATNPMTFMDRLDQSYDAAQKAKSVALAWHPFLVTLLDYVTDLKDRDTAGYQSLSDTMVSAITPLMTAKPTLWTQEAVDDACESLDIASTTMTALLQETIVFLKQLHGWYKDQGEPLPGG